MSKSFIAGDYQMLGVFESTSSPDSWYRVLSLRESGVLSCDCPAWTFKKGGEERSCLHTQMVESLTGNGPHLTGRLFLLDAEPLLAEIADHWHGGLAGQWDFSAREVISAGKTFVVTLSTYRSATRGQAEECPFCLVAFSRRHLQYPRFFERIAGWAGYAIASELAYRGGFPTAGQQPEHFQVKKTPPGLGDLLRMAERTNLGDGKSPEQRAEETLRYFLGEVLYAQVETQHFLDISSKVYPGRVYRLRRDPTHRRERRVRIFEQGRYVKDVCIVRGQDVPEADHYLGNFLGFLADETERLAVVKTQNVFSPHSDGGEKETLPAIWRKR